MKKTFSVETTNELSGNSNYFPDKKELLTSHTDITASHTDITALQKNTLNNEINKESLINIISKLSTSSISSLGTPVRLNEREKREIEDYILIKLRSKGLNGKGISMGKLMRYALRYMLKVEQEAFTECLIKALKKSDDIG